MGEYLGMSLGEFEWYIRGKRIMAHRTEREGGPQGPELGVSFCEWLPKMCSKDPELE